MTIAPRPPRRTLTLNARPGHFRRPQALHSTWPALLLALVWPLGASAAQADQSMAMDKGCYNCHGQPPRKSAPTMAELAQQLRPFRGQPDAARRLADKLREGSVFSHIGAHERLTQQEAERLVQWLIDGGH